MKPELNYTNSEKEKIRNWKESLPKNSNRRFAYIFEENGKLDDEGYKLYNYHIRTDDKFKITIAENITL
jgi:hypothetical protein